MIPKIIHFVWIGSPLPDWAARNMQEFARLNPDHEIRLHTDDVAPPRFAEAYGSAEHPSTRSDLIRYDRLACEGGWYFDVDYWPIRPLADAERAFDLDGRRLFAARMNNPRINNGVLACGAGCEAIEQIAQGVLAGGVYHGSSSRTMFGPPLLTKLAADSPSLFRVADWPWFHGVKDVLAAPLWRRVQRQGNGSLIDLIPQTGGQLPFAFHLWAHTHGVNITAGQAARPVAVICGKKSMLEPQEDRPYVAMADALTQMGYDARIIPWTVDSIVAAAGEVPDLAIVWNGSKGHHLQNAQQARAVGAPVLILEHGFFDRNRYFQADCEGILHRAAWSRRVGSPAPDGSEARLRQFVPEIRPQRVQRDGYVLVLGQVVGDSQLADSEIQGPLPLCNAVHRALAPGVRALFRPHPASQPKNLKRNPLEIFGAAQASESDEYKRTFHGPGLAEALAGARFVVTINSNAIVEALIAGVPVLAFGPSLAIAAGAAHGTTLASLRHDLADMAAGWTAPQDRVENYLRWLAARQWSVEELGRPDVIGQLLAEAGVNL